MDYNNSRREVIIAMLLLLLVIVIGVAGFMQIDNFNFIDSVYMTIITISTVGYGEVKDLSDGGKLFTSGLILASLIIIGYTINKPISEPGIRKKSGANIIGYKNATGNFIINPTPDTKLIPKSKLFVLGTKEQIALMKEMMSG